MQRSFLRGDLKLAISRCLIVPFILQFCSLCKNRPLDELPGVIEEKGGERAKQMEGNWIKDT